MRQIDQFYDIETKRKCMMYAAVRLNRHQVISMVFLFVFLVLILCKHLSVLMYNLSMDISYSFNYLCLYNSRNNVRKTSISTSGVLLSLIQVDHACTTSIIGNQRQLCSKTVSFTLVDMDFNTIVIRIISIRVTVERNVNLSAVFCDNLLTKDNSYQTFSVKYN